MRSNGQDQHDGTLYFDALVRPSASADRIVVSGRTLRIEVRKKAERGDANRAVIRLVAKEFGVNTEQVKIVRGVRGRRKLIKICN